MVFFCIELKNKALLPKNKKYLLTCYVCICVIYSLTYDGANINYKGILNITTIEEVIFKTMSSRFMQVKTNHVHFSLEILA